MTGYSGDTNLYYTAGSVEFCNGFQRHAARAIFWPFALPTLAPKYLRRHLYFAHELRVIPQR